MFKYGEIFTNIKLTWIIPKLFMREICEIAAIIYYKAFQFFETKLVGSKNINSVLLKLFSKNSDL